MLVGPKNVFQFSSESSHSLCRNVLFVWHVGFTKVKILGKAHIAGLLEKLVKQCIKYPLSKRCTLWGCKIFLRIGWCMYFFKNLWWKSWFLITAHLLHWENKEFIAPKVRHIKGASNRDLICRNYHLHVCGVTWWFNNLHTSSLLRSVILIVAATLKWKRSSPDCYLHLQPS